MHTETELFAIAAELGLSDQSAKEMVAEHIARRDENLPRYVRMDLNSCTGVVQARTAKFLDKKFGWNVDNCHRIFGLLINRNKVGDWYIC